MPSHRRTRLAFVAVFATIIILFFYSSNPRNEPGADGVVGEFYSRTAQGLDKQRPGNAQDTGFNAGLRVSNAKGKKAQDQDKVRDGDVDEDVAQLARDMAERLRAAEQQAKDLANQKAPLRPDKPSEVIGVGSSAEGQGKKKMAGKGNGGVASLTERERERVLAQEVENEETQEEHAAEVELNAMLKKAPVIIFSKTYCPHSKRAKRLLLELHKIEPEPFIVELDEHQLGGPIQNLLAKKTGRRTVPNVLVNSVSIGGADDITEMDAAGTLTEKLEYLGSNKVTAVRLSGKRGGF